MSRQSIKLSAVLHTSMVIADLNVSLDFYTRVLNLEIDNSRPELGYPGAWLNLGAQQIHLLQVSNVDPVTGRPEHVGRDRHVAMQVDSIEQLTNVLSIEKIPYTLSKSGRQALFCRDPDGNGLEFVQLN